jgi:ABC-2 type transport system permease protein
MLRQILLLCRPAFINLMGVNEARYGRDPAKRRRQLLLFAAFAFLGVVAVLYVGAFCVGLGVLGLARAIPGYMAVVLSLVVLIFTFFKAGPLIFDVGLYQRQIVLPVAPAAIVASRFLTMYVMDAALSLLILIPAAAVYAWFEHPGAAFYAMMAGGALLLPLLPLTAASILGALIQAAAGRMRHKNAVVIVLSFAVTLGVMAVSFLAPAKLETVSAQALGALGETLMTQLFRAYPPARLFSDGVTGAAPLPYLLFALLSVGVCAAFVVLTARRFSKICTALESRSAAKRYTLGDQVQKSALRALYQKEFRRYFASSVYVLNTLMGEVLLVITGAALCFFGLDSVKAALGMGLAMEDAVPVVLGLIAGMTPTTSCALSMEGRQWWIVKTLPVREKTVLDSKILVQLTLALPSCLVASALAAAGLRPGAAQGVWVFAVPAAFALFSAVFAMAVNVKMPVMKWDAETTVVKQSGSVLVAMLGSFLAAACAIAAMFLLPQARAVLPAALCGLLLGMTALLYRWLCRVRFVRIEGP